MKVNAESLRERTVLFLKMSTDERSVIPEAIAGNIGEEVGDIIEVDSDRELGKVYVGITGSNLNAKSHIMIITDPEGNRDFRLVELVGNVRAAFISGAITPENIQRCTALLKSIIIKSPEVVIRIISVSTSHGIISTLNEKTNGKPIIRITPNDVLRILDQT